MPHEMVPYYIAHSGESYDGGEIPILSIQRTSIGGHKAQIKEFTGAVMENIRPATYDDLSRIAEMVIFNYRLNFYPIFKNDDYYFHELQVPKLMEQYESAVGTMWVYDDGTVKGVVQIENDEIKKLFVEPVLQGNSIGSALLKYAVDKHGANTLWALEKNVRAIRFYERHGFHMTPDKKLEEDTTEYLVRLEWMNPSGA